MCLSKPTFGHHALSRIDLSLCDLPLIRSDFQRATYAVGIFLACNGSGYEALLGESTVVVPENAPNVQCVRLESQRIGRAGPFCRSAGCSNNSRMQACTPAGSEASGARCCIFCA
jgi:hypothetical protein